MRVGAGRVNARHVCRASSVCRLRDRLPRVQQRCELVRRELAQPDEVRHAGVLADANHAEAGAAEVALREPVEVADQEELVEQVVLEPEHDLVVVRKRLERAVPTLVHRERVLVRDVAGLRVVASAQLAERRARHVRGHGPLVQHVGPHGERARHARAFALQPRRVPVQDVQQATPLVALAEHLVHRLPYAHRLPRVVSQDGRQPLPRARDERPHGARGHAERLRHALVTQAVQVVQGERRAVARRQLGDRGTDALDQLLPLQPLERRRPRRRRLRARGLQRGVAGEEQLRPARAQPVHRDAERDAPQPRRELRRVGEQVQVAERADERILRRVLRLRIVAQERCRERAGAGLVAAHQRAERVGVAGARRFHQVGIAPLARFVPLATSAAFAQRVLRCQAFADGPCRAAPLRAAPPAARRRGADRAGPMRMTEPPARLLQRRA